MNGYEEGRLLGIDHAKAGPGYALPTDAGFRGIAGVRFSSSGASDLAAYQEGMKSGFTDGYASVRALPNTSGLASSEGRIFVGVRLYDQGKPVATVLEISDRDPDTGKERDVVLVKFDTSMEPEWKTRDVITTHFQVKAD